MSKKAFSIKEQMRYDFLMKLFSGRLNLENLEAKFQGNFPRYLWMEILFFEFLGAIQTRTDSILLTSKGLYYWVIMMREFFIGVNNFRDHCRNKIVKN